MSIAVVIPTRDRPTLLHRCLDALAGQTLAADEVVVVDDGSEPPVDVPIRTSAPALPLRVLRQSPSRGPASARNLGWRATSATYVAFTDDDCRPDARWLAELRDAARADTVVVGRTTPDERDGSLRAITDRSVVVERCDGLFLTCNVLYPRTLLELLGGFDTSFTRPYGEDTDLGQRALTAGAAAVYKPSALVHHAIHHLDVAGLLRERRRLPELVRLARRYPHLRRQQWSGLFVNPEHRFLLEAVAGMSSILVTPAGLSAVGRYVHRCATRCAGMPPQRRVRDVAGWIALDAYELALCAVGSVRHRAILL